MSLLDNSSIAVQRQLEMMNVLMGFEQADRYVIMDPQLQSYWLSSRASAWHRERLYMSIYRTHRSFTTHGNEREA